MALQLVEPLGALKELFSCYLRKALEVDLRNRLTFMASLAIQGAEVLALVSV